MMQIEILEMINPILLFYMLCSIPIVMLIYYYPQLPFLPGRKYYRIFIRGKDNEGKPYIIRETKGWAVKKKTSMDSKTSYLRVNFRAFPPKNVDYDSGVFQTAQDDGCISLDERVPGLREPENYIPTGLSIHQWGKIKQSCWDEGHATQMERAAFRGKKEGNFLQQYGWLIAICIACLFIYLMIDGERKSIESLEQGRLSVIAGQYAPVNTTQPPPDNRIPFIQKPGV